jgi:hypothetical protein
LPIVEGYVDAIALRGGATVQVLTEAAPPTETAEPVLLRRAPQLRNGLTLVEDVALPPSLRSALEQGGVDPDRVRTFSLRGNAQEVGLVVERRVGGRLVSLSAAPPQALGQAAGVYAAALGASTAAAASDP